MTEFWSYIFSDFFPSFIFRFRFQLLQISKRTSHSPPGDSRTPQMGRESHRSGGFERRRFFRHNVWYGALCAVSGGRIDLSCTKSGTWGLGFEDDLMWAIWCCCCWWRWRWCKHLDESRSRKLSKVNLVNGHDKTMTWEFEPSIFPGGCLPLRIHE